MKYLSLSMLCAAVLTMACGNNGNSTKEGNPAAADFAKSYYDSLFIKGDCDFFVRGRYCADTIPQKMLEDLKLAAQQYVEETENLNTHVDSVSIEKCEPDSLDYYANVYLRLCFKNGKQETILVPMIKRDTIWYMR